MATFGQGKIIAVEVLLGFGFRLSLPVREAAGGLAIRGRLMATIGGSIARHIRQIYADDCRA
jgi:hypothetical protein